ncbi:MAG: nucleotidyltransferase domain-containing protein [Chloroflexi bacterium]|nr:nucleotidyltransferase domain-containing protein [Chloroflexota bacterium]
MKPATSDTAELTAFIEEASAVLSRDERIVAVWLEGSFAGGSADPWSDVDLHVAVPDAEWEGAVARRHEILATVRPILGAVDAKLPWGGHLVSATVAGPVRVDLFLEKLSLLGSAVRREQPVVLYDEAGIANTLKVNWHPEAIVKAQLEQTLRLFFFGSAWPVRLWGREEWGTMMFNAVSLVYQFLVPAMLVQDDPRSYFRPPYHNERHLSPMRRKIADQFVAEIAAAFAGGPPPVSFDRLKSLHERLIAAVWRELRLACEKWGVEYPESAQEAMREYYRRELGFEIKD